MNLVGVPLSSCILIPFSTNSFILFIVFWFLSYISSNPLLFSIVLIAPNFCEKSSVSFKTTCPSFISKTSKPKAVISCSRTYIHLLHTIPFINSVIASKNCINPFIQGSKFCICYLQSVMIFRFCFVKFYENRCSNIKYYKLTCVRYYCTVTQTSAFIG